MQTPVSHYRTRIAWVLGVSGCCAVAAAACGPKRTTAGLLVAPTASATSGDAGAAAARDGGSDAALAYRPLPEEPHGLRGQSCDRDVTCTPALDEAPTWAFPPPFANCGSMPSGGREGDGTFSQAETTDRRKIEADVCCYVKLDCGGSRGTRHKHEVRIVPGRPRRGAAPDDATPAGKWTAMARMELTAVDAFLDYVADLRAHGAPQTLIDAARTAAKEEVSHARLCLELATRDGENVSAARPPYQAPVGIASLEELVACTFLDGCVNEQLAAASMRAAAERAPTEEERDVLLRIADEEQGHAELSWAVLRWAVGTKAGAGEALRAALATLRGRGAQVDDLLLDAEAGASLAYAMLESVVRPAAYALIAA